MLFLKSPENRTLDWLLATPVAHRGFHNASAGIAENSLSAFQAACEHGLPIEFDIRFSRDEIPMVFHDVDLARMTNQTELVSDLDAISLQETQLKNSSDTIPSLTRVLEVVAGRVPLIIEVKPTSLNRAKSIKILQSILVGYTGKFCIQSFDPFILIEFAKTSPHIIRGQLGMRNPPAHMSVYRKFMLRHMLLNPISKPDYIGYDIRDIETLPIQKYKKKSIPLLAWTIKNESDIEKARLYADNVIFEDLAPDYVKNTGCWAKP